MKLYMISGLGADDKILNDIQFPEGIEPVFIPWLQPEKDEKLQHYIDRMIKDIDFEAPFALLGYSFGGFIVQRIHQQHPAEKVILLASIHSDEEMPTVGKIFKTVNLAHYLPTSILSDDNIITRKFIEKFIVDDAELVDKYFVVKDPYYLKWSLEQIMNWDFSDKVEVIQIMGTEDLAFPIKNSNPDYIIEGGSHMFPATHAKEVSEIMKQIFG